MNDIRLVELTSEEAKLYKDDIIKFTKEKFGDDPVVVEGEDLSSYFKAGSYEGWIEQLNYEKTLTLTEEAVPSITFVGVRSIDDKIVGSVTIRSKLNEKASIFGGHIGYDVRPSEQGKHYGSKLLGLSLDYVSTNLDLERVLLTCDKTNVASASIIENNGGVLETEILEPNGNVIQHYWIDVPKIDKQR